MTNAPAYNTWGSEQRNIRVVKSSPLAIQMPSEKQTKMSAMQMVGLIIQYFTIQIVDT